MSLNTILENYLGNQKKTTTTNLPDGSKEGCDLNTGECYVVREKDGLIERVQHTSYVNKKVMVETGRGIKTLLND
jgi:hypothetical protein